MFWFGFFVGLLVALLFAAVRADDRTAMAAKQRGG
jgi:uncharacterized membrane protein